MGGDMAGRYRQSCLKAAEGMVDEGEICLGAAYQKMHVGVGTAKDCLDAGSSFCAIVVHTVSGGGFQIGFGKGLQQLGMAALGVVVFQIVHRFP